MTKSQSKSYFIETRLDSHIGISSGLMVVIPQCHGHPKYRCLIEFHFEFRNRLGVAKGLLPYNGNVIVESYKQAGSGLFDKRLIAIWDDNLTKMCSSLQYKRLLISIPTELSLVSQNDLRVLL